MKKHNFVMCVSDAAYGQNLLHKLKEKTSETLSFYLFHDINQILQFSQNNEIEYLLIEASYCYEERQKIPTQSVFVLIEEVNIAVADTEITIMKYQAASRIYQQIFEANRIVREEYSLEGGRRANTSRFEAKNSFEKNTLIKDDLQRSSSKEQLEGRGKEERKTDEIQVIGVYSPINRIGKTRFAINLGKEYAQHQPALYINMEEFSGESYFPGKLKENLGTLHYLVQQEEQGIGIRLAGMVGQMGPLDYLEPISIMKDLQDIKSHEWITLLNRILQEGIYKIIILDIGSIIAGLFEILQYCDVVYTHYIDEIVALSKLKNYHQNLVKTGYEKVLEHSIQKQVELF